VQLVFILIVQYSPVYVDFVGNDAAVRSQVNLV